MKKRALGFTLMEVMIVVAIIGILAAVAFPSYKNYVMKTNRSVAQQFMLTIANRQELFMLDNRSYTATIGSGGLGLSAPSETVGKYTFAIVDVTMTPSAYTVTATAVGDQAPDGNLSLTSAGAKSPTGKW